MVTIKVARPAESVMLITLDRPKALNALSKALLIEVAGALEDAEADDAVRSVVLTGDERAFSAGPTSKRCRKAAFPCGPRRGG